MGFQTIIGLSALLFVPLIILLYMLRPKHETKKIPSLYLWQSIEDEVESATKLRRLKSSILMLIQILVVILLALILAGLFIKKEQTSSEIILVIDGSLSMQSTDISPSRHERAVGLAKDYVQQLDTGTYITLVELQEVPRVLVSRTDRKSRVLSGIEQLEVANTVWSEEVVMATLNSLKEAYNGEVIYFGDKELKGATIYKTFKATNNIGIYTITTTQYTDKGTLSILTEVFNEGVEEVTVPVSIYADTIFFGAKEVSISGHSSCKVFFDGVPLATHIIKAEVTVEDNLKLDNVAYTVVKQAFKRKVLLISTGHLFLEKFLKLDPTLEVYQANPKDVEIYKGYDLYIFDGLLPKELPKDGELLVFNPPEHEKIPSLGYVTNPVLTTAGHLMTQSIEVPGFQIARTKVFERDEAMNPIYETTYGVSAYSKETDFGKQVIFGFDLRHTDLPLSIEFPILMSQVMTYLLPPTWVETSDVVSGEIVTVLIGPRTTEAYVESPEGKVIHLDRDTRSQLFVQTSQLGVYKVVQVSETTIEEDYFVVNAPMQKKYKEEAGIHTNQVKEQLSSKSLKGWLGLGAIFLILLEWIIYKYRRGLYGY